MTRVVPLVTRGFSVLLMGVSAIALTACAELTATSDQETPVQPEAQTSKTNKKIRAPKTAAKVKDVPAPTAFAATDTAIWDGRPSLGAIWVAHPDAPQAERVQIVNTATGKKIAGALFTRKSRAAGPPIQMSSQAALALGVGPGQTAELKITAIRPEDDIPVQMAKAPANAEIWGDSEPAVAPDTELLLAAQDAPLAGPGPELAGAVPMGVFPDYDAAVLVQARLSQAGVRSEIRETYLDEVIFYKVFAEQADSTVMVAEAKPAETQGFEMASIEQFVLPDQQTTVLTKPKRDITPAAPVQLRLSDAVIIAQLNLPSVSAPTESSLGLALPVTQGGAFEDVPASAGKAETIAPLQVASVSEAPAMKPALTFDAAVQYAGVSLATPSLSDLGGIALPTRAHEDAPEPATSTKLVTAEIAFRPAPRALAKGTATELVASLTRPAPPVDADRPHVRTAYAADPIMRPDLPRALAQVAAKHDTPAAYPKRSTVTVLAAIGPLTGSGAMPSAPNRPERLAQKTASIAPLALASLSHEVTPPQRPVLRPAQQRKVSLMASISSSVAPEALGQMIAPTRMDLPGISTQPDIEMAALGDGVPSVGPTFKPQTAPTVTQILARAKPRPTNAPEKRPEVKVIASILELDVRTIRDATNVGLSPKPLGPGVAEVPNFNFGAAQSGRDDGDWFGLDLLRHKRRN